MRAIIIQTTTPCSGHSLHPGSITTSSSLPTLGLCRCCHCPPSRTPSSQPRTRLTHRVLLSLQCQVPTDALTAVSSPAFPLPEIALFFTMSLPDCTLSLSVVYGQLRTRFNPQLECQLRGMGLIFPHGCISASGNHIWGWLAVARRAAKELTFCLMTPALIANDKSTERSLH